MVVQCPDSATHCNGQDSLFHTTDKTGKSLSGFRYQRNNRKG